jgi:hypothetical protein
VVSCGGTGGPFTLELTFGGDVCGGLDRTSRQRVNLVEVSVYGDAGVLVFETDIGCGPAPVVLDVEPGAYRVVIRGHGDDGKRCWDTGSEGIVIDTADHAAAINVPELCAFDESARLTVEILGRGSVVAEDKGIDCPSVSCAAVYNRFVGVRLTARPDAGSVFTRWSKSCGADDPHVTVSMFRDRACAAEFTSTEPGAGAWGRPEILAEGVAGAFDVLRSDDGLVVAYERDEAIVVLHGAESVAIPAEEGRAVRNPKLLTVAEVVAVYEDGTGCGFLDGAAIETASAPCRAESLHAASIGADGSRFLVTSDATRTELSAWLKDASSLRSVALHHAPSAGGIHSVGNVVRLDGRPAFAFTTYDRELQEASLHVALASTPRPVSIEDFFVQRVASSSDLLYGPSIAVGGGALVVAYGSAVSAGGPTETNGAHLAIADPEPRSATDWTILTLDGERGGSSTALSFGGYLMVAFAGAKDVAVLRAPVLGLFDRAQWSAEDLPVTATQPRLVHFVDRPALLTFEGDRIVLRAGAL